MFVGEKEGIDGLKNCEVVELSVFLHEGRFGGTTVTSKTFPETHRVVGPGLFLHFLRDMGKNELDGMTGTIGEIGETGRCKGIRDVRGKTFGGKILEKLIRFGRVVRGRAVGVVDDIGEFNLGGFTWAKEARHWVRE